MNSVEERIVQLRSGFTKDQIAAILHREPEFCSNLVHMVSHESTYPFPEYASWYLTHLAKFYPGDIGIHYRKIVDTVLNTENQTTLRNCLSIINNSGIESYKEATLYDKLLSFVVDYERAAGIHSYSIQILCKFAKRHPELYNEIRDCLYLNRVAKPPSYHAALKKLRQ